MMLGLQILKKQDFKNDGGVCLNSNWTNCSYFNEHSKYIVSWARSVIKADREWIQRMKCKNDRRLLFSKLSSTQMCCIFFRKGNITKTFEMFHCTEMGLKLNCWRATMRLEGRLERSAPICRIKFVPPEQFLFACNTLGTSVPGVLHKFPSLSLHKLGGPWLAPWITWNRFIIWEEHGKKTLHTGVFGRVEIIERFLNRLKWAFRSQRCCQSCCTWQQSKR